MRTRITRPNKLPRGKSVIIPRSKTLSETKTATKLRTTKQFLNTKRRLLHFENVKDYPPIPN